MTWDPTCCPFTAALDKTFKVFSIVLCSFFNMKTTAAASAPVALALARPAVSSCFPSWFSSGAFNGSSQQLLPALLATKKKPSGFGISGCVLEVGKADEQNYRTEIAAIQLLCQVWQFKCYHPVFEWYFLRGECFEKEGSANWFDWGRSMICMDKTMYIYKHIQCKSWNILTWTAFFFKILVRTGKETELLPLSPLSLS